MAEAEAAREELVAASEEPSEAETEAPSEAAELPELPKRPTIEHR